MGNEKERVKVKRAAMSIGLFMSMMMLVSCANMVVGGFPLSGPLKPKTTANKWVPVKMKLTWTWKEGN